MTDEKKPWEQQYGSGVAGGGAEPWKQDYGPEAENAPAAPRGLKGWGRDIAATAVQGAIGVPEALVGLADIPTGGRVGKFLENEGAAVGFRPKQAKEMVNDWYSDATKEAQRKFDAADGIVDKTVTAIQNPSLIATSVGQSLPSMGMGGVAARGLLAAAPRVAPWVAGAIGEGVTSAGSQAEQVRQGTDDGLLTPEQAALAGATGAATTAFGALGGKVANRLGIGEADTMLAQGMKGLDKQAAERMAAAAANPLVAEAAVKSIPRKVIEGAISEGFLEELPQSVSEQIFQNIALGDPWHKDVDSAAVLGVLSGGAMGGAASGFRGVHDAAFERKHGGAAAPGAAAPADPGAPPADHGAPPAAPNAGLARVGEEFAARLKALQEQEQGEPQVPQAAPPDGAAALARQQAQAQAERSAQIEAGRAQENPDDEIYQSTGADTMRPSEAMGLRPGPDAGTLENVAALAVDTGAHDQVQQAAMLERAAEDAKKAKPVDNQQPKPARKAPAVDPETGEIANSSVSQWSDAELADAFRAAQGRDVRRQLARELSRRRANREDEALQVADNAPDVPDDSFARTRKDAGPVPDRIDTQGVVDTPKTALGAKTDGANVATLAQLNRKQLSDLSADELNQLASLLPADHGRQKKIQKELASRASTAQSAINEGAKTDVTQTSQAQQGGAQPAQAGRAQAGRPAEQGLTRAQRAQRIDDAGAAWTRMPKAERQAIVARLQGVAPVLARNMPGAEWENLNIEVKGKIADAIAPQARPVDVQQTMQGVVSVDHLTNERVDQVASILGVGAKSQNTTVTEDSSRSTQATNAAAVTAAAHEAATSPKNDLPAPTEAQIEAGNYKKGHVSLNGLDISIENPAGSRRRPEWPPLKNHYGYIKGSVGADKDHVDVFMTDRAHDPALPVFVVDQVNKDGSFDEHKVVLGAADEAEARSTYLGNYAKGWTGLGGITKMTQDQFKDWASDAAKTKKPAGTIADTRKPRGVLAKKAAAKESARADYFTPGNIVRSYGGTLDRVLAYKPADESGNWSVKVQSVIKKDGAWAADPKDDRVRVHATAPSAKELKEGRVGRWPAQSTQEKAEAAASPQDFIPAPDGGLDYGEITSEMGKAMRRQAGKIRLEAGDDSYGERHIELRHGKDIRNAGFSSVSEFVADIARHIDQIWKPSTTAQMVAIHRVGNDRVMYVELRQALDEAGDYYTVRTAFPTRREFVKNKGWNLLWEGRAQPSADSGSSAPFAVQSSNESGRAATIPSGSKTEFQTGDGSEPTSAVTGQRPAFATAASASPETESSQSSSNARGQNASVAPATTADKPEARKPSADQTRAKADLMSALADLGDILGKNTRLNILPEQEQKLLPVLTRVLDAAFRLGYHKFKDAAKFALDQIRVHLGGEAADALTLDQLQGAYIAMAGGKRGADSKRAVIDIEDKAEIEAHEATPDDAESATMSEASAAAGQNGEKANERTDLRGDGPQALGPVATAEGGRTEGQRGTGTSPADSREGNAAAGAGADEAGLSAARGGRSGAAAVRPAQARTKGQAGAVGTQGDGRAGARVPQDDGRVAVPGGEASAPNIPAADFQITDEVELGKGGEVQKFNDNLAAIRALKQIEAEGRRATPNEQALLARYVGWGGLANAFPDPISGNFKDKWKERGEALRELLTKEEYAAARRSTRNAHYTSQTVVSAMWNMVRRLGYRGGLVLESSMGTGNFLGLAPKDMPNRFVGVEYDSLTARIGQALYPQATVLHSGFQKVPVADNAFMLNIGNPPFGSESLRFQFKPELQGVSIHNQFFRAGMDALRPGGLQAMVVSRFLMDAQDKSTRLALAQQARLVAAFRLPDTAFKENARTEVVTDILIFQKLEPTAQAAMEVAVAEYRKLAAKKKDADKAAAALVPAWVETTQVPDPLGGEPMTVNAYFKDNDKNVLGVLERSGSMAHSADITVRLDNPAELGAMLREAAAHLPENIQDFDQQVLEDTAARHKSMSDALRIAVANEEAGHVKRTPEGLQRVIERETPEGDYEFAYQTINENSPWHESLSQDANGRWYVLEQTTDADGKPIKAVDKDGRQTRRNLYERKVFATPADVPEKMRLGKLGLQRLEGLVGLRDLLKRQLVLETADAARAVMEGNRKALAQAYAAFVKANGPVNRSTNLRMAMTMPDGGLVAALEVDYQPARTAEQAARSGLTAQKEQATTAPILRERVVPKYEPATKAATTSDALAITLAERGRVDMERIAGLLGVSQEEAAQQLQQGEEPLVFQDPETKAWETADAYLSGMVKRKLNAARAADMDKNVQALEKVIPADWTAENVTATMGGTWIPADVYADFVQHLAGGKARVVFSPLTNGFSVSLEGGERGNVANWSTEGAPVDYIVSRILNSKAVTVMGRDADGNTYIDKEKTALAGLKAREIEAEFGDWVFKDGGRRQRLVSIFNEKFNTRVVRQFNGQHLQLPGKVPDALIKMRRHQMNAIWRGIYERFMLVDHAVGAGKTFTAIARAMERRRMGLSRKPMIVVPNHLVEQWEADVYRLYPGAKVLAAGKKDFEAKRRRRLFGKIATGDWDIVIVPHSSFGFIGIAPETESRYLELEMAQAQDAIKNAWEQAREDAQDGGRRKPFGVKEAERLAEKIQGRMDRLAEGVRDRLLTFEQLGVDDLTVDEAHEFKNLYYSSNLTGVRGMGDKTGSRKANDLYNKVRVLREQPTGSVTFLTGTPISNSAVEMFTMLRYLAADALQDMGLSHFDAFRAQFVEATPAFEPTESGRLKQVTRLGRTWSNMRSLMDLYYQVTDAVSLDDIKRFYAEDNGGAAFPVPKIAGGKDRQLVTIKPTPAQDAELKAVMVAFDGLDDISDPYERNAERLRLMDRARKLSLDIRAVDPRNPSQEVGGKLQVVSENIKRIYDKWNDDKGTQLVFLDRSVPKAKGDDKIIKEYEALQERRSEALRTDDQEAFDAAQEALDRYDANEIAELRLAQTSPWSAYQQIKDNLVAMGIPTNEIRFVQEANNDEQKAALFDAVRGGKVRVLLGSTPRMGAGTNVQDRAVALHHVDVTWKPSDIEQREGRVIRQGNLFATPPTQDRPNPMYREGFEVELLAYATERTTDAKMWDLNATKLRTINGIRKYTGAFTMEFEDEEAVGMAEMAALASGNPLLLERVKVESEIQTLELQERAHRRRMWGVEDELRYARKAIEENPGRIESAKQRRSQAKDAIAALEAEQVARSVTIEGKTYDTIKDAFAAAEDIVKDQQGGNDKARYAVTINGRRVTTKDGISDQITAALGDVDPFAATVGGKTFTQRTAAAREVAERMNEAMKGRDELQNLPLGQMLGYQLVGDMVPMQMKDGSTVYEPSLTLMDGDRTVTSHAGNVQTGELAANNLRGLLQGLVNDIYRNAKSSDPENLASQMARAERDLPGLEKRKDEGFPKAQELADKRARLAELVKLLEGKEQAAPTTEAQAEANAGGDVANFAGAQQRRPGSAQDKIALQAIADGKSARDVLRVIASGSRNPFNRQVARLLLKAGITPKVVFGHIGKNRGNPIHGQYKGSTDTIHMAGSSEFAAERIFLHEAMHAATLRALRKPGLNAIQLRKLYEHVKKQQGVAGFYGIKNIDEFVAEVFTNPGFQDALRGINAPSGSALKTAWDGFVRIVRSILGLSNDTHSALSQALSLGAGVVREDMALRRRAVETQVEDAANFGTDDLTRLKTSAIDQITQTFTHPGKVSLWDKTVGTMRNLAERVPQFKPVFEAAQRFIDDVSMLANDAADAAPRLMPRVETLADIKKKPITGADNKAVAKPLFEGTLMWARDLDGKPVTTEALSDKYRHASVHEKAQILLRTGKVQEQMLKVWQGQSIERYETIIGNKFNSTILKPGVVWSEKELKTLFGLSDGQVSLYQEARAAIDRSIDMTARTDMLRLMGEDYTDMRDAVLEQPTLQDAHELVVGTLQADARENEEQADRLLQISNQVSTRYETATELMEKGYAPLSRFGRYTVDVVDQAGERQYFGLFESKREANLMKIKMVSVFPGASVTQGTMSQEAFKLFQGITPESLEQFGEMLGLSGAGSEAKDKAFQAYLQLAKNNHSALKRLIHRKGIAGYSEDVGRVLASFVYSNARLGSGGLNAGTMEKAVEGIPKEMGELRDVAMGLRSYIQDPQEEGQAVRGMLFAQYLGGSVASAFVNMTQPFQITVPWLSQFGGIRQAAGQMARALKDMGTKGIKYESDLAKALQEAVDDGTVSPQEIHQLMAQARGTGSLRAGDGTRLGDARAAAANNWERVKVAWGQPFALAEQFNRRSTFIAAYRTAKEQGMSSPAEFARRAVLETQFLYSKANKPTWGRGVIGGTLFTFKTYSISYLELMHRMWTQGGPEGKRAVGWAVAMLLLMGGAGGLPFMEDAEDLIDGAGQLMGYNLSSKQWRKELLRDVVGKELGEFMEYGVSGLPGAPIDLSGRLGLGNLIPGTGLLLSKQSRERDLLEVTGPAGDLIARGFTGARKFLTGDLSGAALDVSPTAVRNWAKGTDMWFSGIYKDTKGYKVLDTTLAEAAAKFGGFQPRSVADVQEANSFMQRSKSFYIQTSNNLKAQWAQAVFEKDDAALQRVRDRVDAWNRNNPEQPIFIRIPDVMKRVREMGTARTQRIADTAPKALRQQMREVSRELAS